MTLDRPLNARNWKGGRLLSKSDGYIRLFMPEHPLAQSDGYVLEHRMLAEAALGRPLPKQVEIHHFDENKANNSRSNLVLCQDRRYHRLLHARMRVKLAGGNPNTDRTCYRCGITKLKTDFKKSRNAFDGRDNECRECSKKRAVTYRSKKEERKECKLKTQK